MGEVSSQNAGLQESVLCEAEQEKSDSSDESEKSSVSSHSSSSDEKRKFNRGRKHTEVDEYKILDEDADDSSIEVDLLEDGAKREESANQSTDLNDNIETYTDAHDKPENERFVKENVELRVDEEEEEKPKDAALVELEALMKFETLNHESSEKSSDTNSEYFETREDVADATVELHEKVEHQIFVETAAEKNRVERKTETARTDDEKVENVTRELRLDERKLETTIDERGFVLQT